MKNPLVYISKALSYFFHPIIIPTLVILIFALFSPSFLLPISENFILFFSLFIFLCTWVMPAIAIYGLYLSGIIKNIFLEDRKDRIIALTVNAAIYTIVSLILYYKFRANDEVMLLLYTSILCQLIAIILTTFSQISLHSMGMWGVVCYLATVILLKESEDLFVPLNIMILLSGCVMSARLYLQKHTIGQISLGALASTLVSIILYLVVYKIII